MITDKINPGDLCKTASYNWIVLVETINEKEQIATCFILESRSDPESVGTHGAWCICDLDKISDNSNLQHSAQESIVNKHVSDCPCELCKIVTERWNQVEDYSCDQCQALMINGVYCHETGCPNTHKVKVDGEWVRAEEEEESD